MKNKITIITLITMSLFLGCTQLFSVNTTRVFDGEVLAYIEFPDYSPGDVNNPVIIISSIEIYNAILNYIGKRSLTDVKHKKNSGEWELAFRKKGILIHMLDPINSEEYRKTILVEKEFIRVESTDKIEEYLKETEHLDALIFTLGIQQGIFQLPE